MSVVSVPGETNRASQSAPSLSFTSDTVFRAQAASQAAQATRVADAVQSSAAPQSSQPMPMSDEQGNTVRNGLKLPAPQDPSLSADAPPTDNSQPNASRAPSGPNAAPMRAVGSDDSIASSGDAATGDLALLPTGSTRGALLTSLPFNVSAVDQALAAMMIEVEGLGGELAGWLEESSVPAWAILATVVVTCTAVGWYFGYLRPSGSLRGDSEEESSSWLFTQLESPIGQR